MTKSAELPEDPLGGSGLSSVDCNRSRATPSPNGAGAAGNVRLTTRRNRPVRTGGELLARVRNSCLRSASPNSRAPGDCVLCRHMARGGRQEPPPNCDVESFVPVANISCRALTTKSDERTG